MQLKGLKIPARSPYKGTDEVKPQFGEGSANDRSLLSNVRLICTSHVDQHVVHRLESCIQGQKNVPEGTRLFYL